MGVPDVGALHDRVTFVASTVARSELTTVDAVAAAGVLAMTVAQSPTSPDWAIAAMRYRNVEPGAGGATVIVVALAPIETARVVYVDPSALCSSR